MVDTFSQFAGICGMRNCGLKKCGMTLRGSIMHENWITDEDPNAHTG